MSDNAYWTIALVLGLIVAVVVVVLLETFLREVHRIEKGAGLVWTAGKQVARNTATTWLLPETSHRLTLLTDEAMLHVALLSAKPASGLTPTPGTAQHPAPSPAPSPPTSPMTGPASTDRPHPPRPSPTPDAERPTP